MKTQEKETTEELQLRAEALKTLEHYQSITKDFVYAEYLHYCVKKHKPHFSKEAVKKLIYG